VDKPKRWVKNVIKNINPMTVFMDMDIYIYIYNMDIFDPKLG